MFVDALGRSSPLDDAEACIYGYGAIKFLTMNSTLLDKILNLGILQLMVLHMKIVNAAVINIYLNHNHILINFNYCRKEKNLRFQNQQIM